jgi:hypothetical protein
MTEPASLRSKGDPRPIDRGLLAATRTVLRAIVPPGREPIRPTVRVRTGGGTTVAEARVRWIERGREVGHFASASDDHPTDGGNLALAKLLGRLERVRTGTTTAEPPPARGPSMRSVPLGPATKKPVARVGGQLARGSDPALRDEIAARLDAAVPANAKETGRTLDLYALQPGVFRAKALLSYRSPRGKLSTVRAEGTGRGPDAKNEALRALLAQLSSAPRG